jgi:hypothetical protein
MLPTLAPAPASTIRGQVHPDFEPVAGTLEWQLHGQPGGAAVCVYPRGEAVVDIWGGAKDETGFDSGLARPPEHSTSG